jgi:hypothetical protein
VPFNQSIELDAELTGCGMLHEFYAYEGLSHCFSTSAGEAKAQQMIQDSLSCLRRALASRQKGLAGWLLSAPASAAGTPASCRRARQA